MTRLERLLVLRQPAGNAAPRHVTRLLAGLRGVPRGNAFFVRTDVLNDIFARGIVCGNRGNAKVAVDRTHLPKSQLFWQGMVVCDLDADGKGRKGVGLGGLARTTHR